MSATPTPACTVDAVEDKVSVFCVKDISFSLIVGGEGAISSAVHPKIRQR